LIEVTELQYSYSSTIQWSTL